MEKSTIRERVLDWMLHGDVGVSSETIARRMLDEPPPRIGESHPYDDGDFHRCLQLLKRVPEFRERLGEMSLVSKEWAALVKQWGHIENVFLCECGLNFTTRPTGPKTYALIKKILETVV